MELFLSVSLRSGMGGGKFGPKGGRNNKSRENYKTRTLIISSPDINTMIKTRKMWWVRHATCYGRDKKSIQSFGRKPLKERKKKTLMEYFKWILRHRMGVCGQD
jgi:hypothetical protein